MKATSRASLTWRNDSLDIALGSFGIGLANLGRRRLAWRAIPGRSRGRNESHAFGRSPAGIPARRGGLGLRRHLVATGQTVPLVLVEHGLDLRWRPDLLSLI